jgi:anti-sigma regulatory factor (Ser/Thr protein kinase)
LQAWVRRPKAPEGYNNGNLVERFVLTRHSAGDGAHIYEGSFMSVRQARAALAGLAIADEEVKQRALLVLSELATNAVLHAGVPFGLRLVYDRGSVRIEVEDPSTVVPAIAAATTMSGRGLRIVAALSARWGYEVSSNGKVVWAEVG